MLIDFQDMGWSAYKITPFTFTCFQTNWFYLWFQLQFGKYKLQPFRLYFDNSKRAYWRMFYFLPFIIQISSIVNACITTPIISVFSLKFMSSPIQSNQKDFRKVIVSEKYFLIFVPHFCSSSLLFLSSQLTSSSSQVKTAQIWFYTRDAAAF